MLEDYVKKDALFEYQNELYRVVGFKEYPDQHNVLCKREADGKIFRFCSWAIRIPIEIYRLEHDTSFEGRVKWMLRRGYSTFYNEEDTLVRAYEGFVDADWWEVSDFLRKLYDQGIDHHLTWRLLSSPYEIRAWMSARNKLPKFDRSWCTDINDRAYVFDCQFGPITSYKRNDRSEKNEKLGFIVICNDIER